MEGIIINLIGFGGAWALFAGSIYQAAIELREEGQALVRLRHAGPDVEKPERVSVWWWVIPPVAIYLQNKARKAYEKRWWSALDENDRSELVDFRNKAFGWQIVAVGGICIGIKETYELIESLHLNTVVLIIAVLVMIFAGIANLIYRLSRETGVTGKRER